MRKRLFGDDHVEVAQVKICVHLQSKCIHLQSSKYRGCSCRFQDRRTRIATRVFISSGHIWEVPLHTIPSPNVSTYSIRRDNRAPELSRHFGVRAERKLILILILIRRDFSDDASDACRRWPTLDSTTETCSSTTRPSRRSRR